MKNLSGKKLLFVITKSNWGGAQQYVYTLATRCKEEGAEVAVALGGTGEPGAPPGLLAARLQEAGVRTIFLKSFMRDVGLMSEYAAFFELLRIIRAEEPEVLHVNSSKAGGMGALAGRLCGVPAIVFTAHGWAHREPRRSATRFLIWLASWATVALAHRVIVLSKRDADDAPAAFFRHKISVIHNGIRPFRLLPREEARAALGATAFPFWFLALAELHPNKGLASLVRAFAGIKDECPDAALAIVGGGELKSELELLALSLAPGRVRFPGFVQNGRACLSAADVFVLPSLKEGLPFVILEAGLARLPVIASSVGAIPEVVADGKSGILIPPGDELELAQALRKLYGNAGLREALGGALHARVTHAFSEETMFAATVRLYRP